MAVEFGIWRIAGTKTAPVAQSALPNEALLEALIEQDPSILGLGALLIIARQHVTPFGTRTDLVALDDQATLYLIEVKKGRTPRDVVAQALDYGYWISTLTLGDVDDVYAAYKPGEQLADAFAKLFGSPLPDALSGEHRLLIVASSFDGSTDRIVRYVRGQGVPVFVVFFQYFKEDEHEFLARSWDADPQTQEAKAPVAKKPVAPWNGQDFYVAFGEDVARNWDDALKYGFVSAGGGKWYSQTLRFLFVGARIFVYIPKVGYVGVGIVTETAQRAKDFMVSVDGKTLPILEAGVRSPEMGRNPDDDDLCDYLVRVEWIKTLPRESGIWEKGMFANQNSVVKLRDQFTLDRLVTAFGLGKDE